MVAGEGRVEHWPVPRVTLTTQGKELLLPPLARPTPALPPLPQTVRNWVEGRATFNAHAQAIFDEWLERQANKPARRAESPNAWFKREAYRLLAHYIENRLARIFQLNAQKDLRPNRLVTEALKNPFKLGLLAMFSDESTLSPNNRHVFGNQMLYAWAHDVPPDFLNAFLAISGGPAQISKKLKQGEAEPGFEHRFKPERLPA